MASCTTPRALLLGDNTGTNFASGNLTDGSCQVGAGGGAGDDAVFQYTPDARQDLLLQMDSAADQGLVVHGTCGSSTTETACVDSQPGGVPETLELRELPAGVPLYIFVSAFVSTEAGAYTLRAQTRPILPDQSPCDLLGTANRCDTGLVCSDFGGAARCQPPPTGLQLACAAAATTGTDGTLASNTRTAPLLDGPSCANGGPTRLARYVVRGPGSVDVRVDLQSAADHALSVRTDCLDAQTEVRCQDATTAGTETATYEDVAAGTPLVVVATGTGEGADFSLAVTERAVLGTGAACDVNGVLDRCRTGLLCQGSCVVDAPPALTAAEAFALDVDGTAGVEALRLILSGGDANADVVNVVTRFLDASSQPVDLLTGGAPSGSERTVTAPAALRVESFSGEVVAVDGLAGVTNLDQVMRVGLVLVDARGHRSPELEVTLAALPVRARGVPCDGLRDSCAATYACLADATGTRRCFNLGEELDAACAAALPLQAGVEQAGDTGPGMDLTSLGSCEPAAGAPRDAFYTYTVVNPTADVRFSLTAPADHRLAVRLSCADAATRIACQDSFTATGNNVVELGDQHAGAVFAIVVSAVEPAGGTLTLRVDERPVLGSGAACDPAGVADRCGGTLACRDQGAGPVCLQTDCGNGVLAGTEECDDGNITSGDGCSELCRDECRVTEEEPDGADGPQGVVIPEACRSAFRIAGTSANQNDGDYYLVHLAAGDNVRTWLANTWVAPTTCTFNGAVSILPAPVGAPLTRVNTYCVTPPDPRQLVCQDYCNATPFIAPADGDYVFRPFVGWTLNQRYLLQLGITPARCGNGRQEGTEACDDGNTAAGDGCSAACQWECTVPESGDASPASPQDVTFPPQCGGDVTVRAALPTTSDVDVFRVTLAAGQRLRVSTSGSTVLDCSPDTLVDVHLEGAATLSQPVDCTQADAERVACHDDLQRSGGRLCSDLEFTVTAAGTYVVRVATPSAVPLASYAVRFRVAQTGCGNGLREGAEQCDDGNTAGGDGCSATCTDECVLAETSPTSADSPQEIVIPPGCRRSGVRVQPASLQPQGDEDYFLLHLQAGETLEAETFGAVPGVCGGGLDTVMDVRAHPLVAAPVSATCSSTDANRLACNDDVVAGNLCSSLSLANPTARDVVVRVVYFRNAASAGSYGVRINQRGAAVCGNGALEGTETCDDGNTTAGDGCSATCADECLVTDSGGNSYNNPQVVTVPSQCSTLTLKGTFSSATDDADFRFTLVPGQRLLTWAWPGSPFVTESSYAGNYVPFNPRTYDPNGICARGTASQNAYLDCRVGTQDAPFALAATAGGPYILRLFSQQNAAAGAYTVKVTIPPASCGNGALETGEQCDDGNQTVGDGCRPDCTDECRVVVQEPSALDTPTAVVFPPQCTRLVFEEDLTTLGDEDTLSVHVPAGYALVTDITGNQEQCDSRLVLQVYEPAATPGAATTGYCPTLSGMVGCASGCTLTAPVPVEGDYRVRLAAMNGTGLARFGLRLAPPRCGDNLVMAPEQCEGAPYAGTCTAASCTSPCTQAEVPTASWDAPQVVNLARRCSAQGQPGDGYTGVSPALLDGPGDVDFYRLDLVVGDKVEFTVPWGMQAELREGPLAAEPVPAVCGTPDALRLGCWTSASSFTATAAGSFVFSVGNVPGVNFQTSRAYGLWLRRTHPACGNSVVETGELCDDGNTNAGDGCSATCTWETLCGNSVIEYGENCDDGNTDAGDGCSATCQNECGNLAEDAAATSLNPQRVTVLPGCGNWVRVIGTTPTNAADNDYYVIHLAAGQAVTAQTYENGYCYWNFDSVVSILPGPVASDPVDSCGGSLACNDAAYGYYYCSLVSYRAPADGDYVVRMYGKPMSSGATYSLRFFITTPTCGNGSVEAGEACDDGNLAAGDGCSPECTSECTLTKTAATSATAPMGIFMSPACGGISVTGSLAGAADDYFRVTVPAGKALVVSPNGVGSTPCGTGATSLDPVVSAYASPLAAAPTSGDCTVADADRLGCADDAAGGWACAPLNFRPAAPGDYVLRLHQKAALQNAGYQLSFSLANSTCGNGTVETAEQCDDGNTTGGDGCSATCQRDCTVTANPGPYDAPGVITLPPGCTRVILQRPTSPALTQDYYVITVGAGQTVEAGIVPNAGSAWCGNYPYRSVEVRSSPVTTPPTGGTCGTATPEQLACAEGPNPCTTVTWAAASAGDRVIRVSGKDGYPGSGWPNDYNLAVRLVDTQCGNGTLEVGEECDDSNTTDGDRCSATCRDECVITETEPNTYAAPPLLTPPAQCTSQFRLNGALPGSTPEQDYFKVHLAAGETLEVKTFPDFDGVCSPSGLRGMVFTSPVAAAPTPYQTCMYYLTTGGARACSVPARSTDCMNLVYRAVTAGDYVVHLGSDGEVPRYQVRVRRVQTSCGNSTVELGEPCDDGNTTSGDACSATCVDECNYPVVPETAYSTPFVVTPVLACHPQSFGPFNLGSGTADDEHFRFTLAAGDLVKVQQVDAPGQPCASQTRVGLELRRSPASSSSDRTCSTTDTNRLSCTPPSGSPYTCSTLTYRVMAAGDYAVRVYKANDASWEFNASITIEVLRPTCGNSIQEEGETCDDGNTTGGDGCSPLCMNECEFVEAEPNDTLAAPQVLTLAAACAGRVAVTNARANSVNADLFRVHLEAGELLRATTTAEGTCPSDVVSLVDVRAVTGATPGATRNCNTTAGTLACDRFTGTGDRCARSVDFVAPVAGDYVVGVANSVATMLNYRLEVSVGPPGNTCGNATLEPGETCDDGNTVAGDGCSDTCVDECTVPETEPNLATPQALTFPAGCTELRVAASLVTSDTDHFLVHLAAGQVLVAETRPRGPYYPCTTYSPGTTLTLLPTPLPAFTATSCSNATLGQPAILCNDDRGGSPADYCSALRFTAPADGDWVVRVTPPGGTLDYTLAVRVAAAACGNGQREAAETCDDGNTTDGDGCSAACAVETTACEAAVPEPTSSAAPVDLTPPAGCSGVVRTRGAVLDTLVDEDFFRVHLEAGQRLTATTNTPGVACARLLVDVRAEGGTATPARDCADADTDRLRCDQRDDRDLCSVISYQAPAAGDYLLHVTNPLRYSPGGSFASASSALAAYELVVAVDQPTCGDGVVQGDEGCDDGNTTAGDGCSASCAWECGSTEAEPNPFDAPQVLDIPPACRGSFHVEPLGFHPGTNDDYLQVHLGAGSTLVAIPHARGLPGECTGETAYIRVALVRAPLAAALPSSSTGLASGSCGAPLVYSVGAEGDYLLRVINPDGEELDVGLELIVYTPRCGDGVVEGVEACDDGNAADGDGCSSQCLTECTTLEQEPNPATTPQVLQPLAACKGWVRMLGGDLVDGTDRDFFRITAQGGRRLVVQACLVPGATGAPPQLALTSLAGAGAAQTCTGALACSTTVNGCQEISYTPPADGDLAVAAFSAGSATRYTLDVRVADPVCGDRVAEGAEECDDGNQASGDGCSASCRWEGKIVEVEPNDDGTPALGNAPTDFSAAAVNGPFTGKVLIRGSIMPAGDEDTFLVANNSPSPATLVLDLAGAAGPGTCDNTTGLYVRDGAGTLVQGPLPSNGSCAHTTYTLGARGVAYITVVGYRRAASYNGWWWTYYDEYDRVTATYHLAVGLQ